MDNEYKQEIITKPNEVVTKKPEKKSAKSNTKKTYTLEDLKSAKSSEQVFDVLIKEVDEDFNLHGFFANGLPCVVPREEVSSVVADDGLVDPKYCTNKENKIMQVCIKEIFEKDGKIESAILSKRILELKVRRWMYMHLKDGMRLKGVVRGMNDFAAFVDVGGGVTGLLKIDDISHVKIQKVSDKLRLGQRLEVLVKKYDRDTGKIELSLKDLDPKFSDAIKKLHEGDTVEGIVRSREKNGIFIELKNGLVGLSDHVNGVEYGQEVLVYIKRINEEKGKIKLKIIG